MTDEERERAIDEAKHLISAGMVAELIVDIRAMASAILAFGEHLAETQNRVKVAEEQVKEIRSLRARNWIVSAAAMVLALAVAAAVTAFVLNSDRTTDKLTTIAEGNALNGQILVECTTPTPTSTTSSVPPHDCFERGQQATAGAIASINDTTINAAVCARLHDTPEAIRSCVTALVNP